MGKGEIARYEQFLLFPQCFQKACFPGASKGVIVWEWVKAYLTLLNDKILALTKLKAFADDKFSKTIMVITAFDMVENIVGKGENAGYQHFLPFPQCFQKASYTGSLKVMTVW